MNYIECLSSTWPADVFSTVVEVAPQLFTEQGATSKIRGYYLGVADAKIPVRVVQAPERAGLKGFVFALPLDAETHLKKIGKAISSTAKDEGLPVLPVKKLVAGQHTGIALGINARRNEAGIYVRDSNLSVFSSVSSVTKDNAAGAYRIKAPNGFTAFFDNRNGIGETPNGKAVLYFGCVAHMDPKVFLSLCRHVTNAEDFQGRVAFARSHIESGGTIATPILDLNVANYVEDDLTKKPSIVGHEGRARATALIQLGLTTIPVNLLFAGGARARHIKDWDQLKNWLNAGIESENGQTITGAVKALVHA